MWKIIGDRQLLRFTPRWKSDDRRLRCRWRKRFSTENFFQQIDQADKGIESRKLH